MRGISCILMIGLFTGAALADDGPAAVPVFPWKWDNAQPAGHITPHIECMVGNTSFEVDWNPAAPGGTAQAVAHGIGFWTVLWKTSLIATGPRPHSAFRNRIAMEADAKYMVIYGIEGSVNYIEVKDAASGDTLTVTQLWPTINIVTGQRSPPPATAPTYGWEWDAKRVDQPLTVGNSKYHMVSEKDDAHQSLVIATDIDTGRQLWQLSLKGFGRWRKPAESAHFILQMANGKLLAYCTDSRGWFIEAIEPRTGLSDSVIQFWRRPVDPTQPPKEGR